ncbi:hypothetical protein METUNv1_03553 [Methyloversatilis universalis FAM5]|uniref:Uncharacterized protein n=1 Tax=Methyloversatilis universalis (strain ATCC BAA-1314 / DSM 25237 / JCM 13912 / CCUG 52030 / FAM5) TaxID=1000565 RepID=F5RGW2_METUF|nr:hypothetical protein METUNv1_03553 [Methyloversatilis universalis FAM5]
MGKIKRSLAAIAVLAVLILVGVATLVWQTGYSISEMDWDSDGETSLAELWRAIDVGRRSAKRDGVYCQEFFNLKDGLPIRVDCPESTAKK